MAGKSRGLKPPNLRDLSDDALLDQVYDTLLRLTDPLTAQRATRVADDLLANGGARSSIDIEGLRAMLFQITRNRDIEMQSNHLTELRIADALAQVEGRHIDIEKLASGRNERRVDFALDDERGTTLVEVKNLNAPMIKKAADGMSEEIRLGLQGSVESSDLHLVYLFFRRPRNDELPAVMAGLREAWRNGDARRSVLVPHDRARIAAYVSPARADTGGRVIVYDHGQHLHAEPGSRLRVSHHERHHQRRPRERMEELFVKDNILRRLQDAEQKFPLSGDAVRVVLFCQGSWAPVSHVDRCLDEAVHWYLHGQPATTDIWGEYYPHWARRWQFRALHNVDAILAMRPIEGEADDEHAVLGGDIDFSVRPVYQRDAETIRRVFEGA